jgi:hypothetical protein
VQHLEDGERHALEHDVLPDDPRDEVAPVDLLEQGLGELHEVRIRVARDHVFPLAQLDPEIEQPPLEDLDVTGLIQRLCGQEDLARLVGRGVDETRRCSQRTALACHELHRQ